jgi:STE24 endopeptidase
MTWMILAFALATSPGQSAAPPITSWDPAQLTPVAVPEPSPLAMDYYWSGLRLWFVSHAWSLLVPAVILFSGLSGRMRDLARKVGRNWYGTIAVYALLYLGLTYLIDLPIDYYLGYLRSHKFGLSHQPLDRWIGDGLKSLGVTAVGAVLLLWVPYLILARCPRTWWVWTGVLTLPFALGGAMIKPIWIDPLFHSFAPMKDKGLEAKILAIAQRAGIAADHVFEVDMSRDTRTINAYVTGLFGTKRIVLWDTLLARLDEDEVLAVMGHEMGHYVLNHVAWGVSLATFGSLLLLFLVDRSGRALIARFGPRFGFDRLSDVASVPLFLLLLSLFNLVGAPISLAVNRTMEHEADRFSLEVTRMNRSAATSFAKFVDDNLSNPRPDFLSVLWRSTHPPIGDRIDFCNQYHPWTEGRAGWYEDRFVTPRARR